MELNLDLLKFKGSLQIQKKEGQAFIFDPIRKKYLVQTPEEVVRQLFLSYLLQEKGFPLNRIRTEKVLKVNELTKRCDILVFDWDMGPYLLVECKAPSVPISEATFQQIARYNMPLKVAYLVMTNGLTNWCCQMDYENKSWQFVGAIPIFPSKSSY